MTFISTKLRAPGLKNYTKNDLKVLKSELPLVVNVKLAPKVSQSSETLMSSLKSGRVSAPFIDSCSSVAVYWVLCLLHIKQES